jgi:hypothetical protein
MIGCTIAPAKRIARVAICSGGMWKDRRSCGKSLAHEARHEKMARRVARGRCRAEVGLARKRSARAKTPQGWRDRSGRIAPRNYLHCALTFPLRGIPVEPQSP